MKEINLLTGGPKDMWPNDLVDKMCHDVWVGADKGAVYLAQAHADLLLSIGDFDSSTKEEIELVKQASKSYDIRPLKDDITDTQLAILETFKRFHPNRINVYGATGARLDQLLANLLMFTEPRMADYVNQVVLYDKYNVISFYVPGNYTICKIQSMHYLAFIPLTCVKGLTLKKVKYELDNEDFSYPVSLSSNEFINSKAYFSFDEGIVCVVQSKD